jgi:hypothetical protein
MTKSFYRCITFVLCLIFLTIQSEAQITYGPEAGFTAAGLYTSRSDVYAGINGHVGFTAHFQVTDFLGVRPSILYRFGTMANSEDNTRKITLNRIAVPVPIVYAHVFPNNGLLFGGVGPNFMYNLSGSEQAYGESVKINFSGDSAEMKRLDVGLHFTGGYQFSNGLALSLFFNAGLTNISKDPNTNLRSLDAFGFSIGWMFGSTSRDQ